MMKTLIIANDLELGGIQKSLISFLKYLKGSNNHEIDLMLWQKEGALKSEVPENVNIIFQDYATTLKNIKETIGLLSKIKLLVGYLRFKFFSVFLKKPWLFYPKNKKKYDVVIAYSHNGYPKFYAVDRTFSSLKYLWFHHGSYEVDATHEELNKIYYNKFDKIVTVSDPNREMLLKHFPAYDKKIVVVPNIIDVQDIIEQAKVEISDIEKEHDFYNFVTISRFSKEKGIDFSISVAKELKNKGLKFKWYFIGDGETFKLITEKIKDLQLEKECILLGSRKNPYPYINIADLYIQTSHVESQSITINEALVLKKIVVSTDLPVLKSALNYGELGVLCEANIEKFATEIILLLSDFEKQKKIKENLNQHIINNENSLKAINELFHNYKKNQ